MLYTVIKRLLVWHYYSDLHAPLADDSDDSKERFYEELEHMFNHFPNYHMKITLEDFNAQLGRDVLIPKVGKETLHDSRNDNRVRVVNFATSENLVKSTMFPHRNIPEAKSDN